MKAPPRKMEPLAVKGALRHPKKLALLEALRGFAATYVFVGHVAIMRFRLVRGSSALLFQFGQEAVMLFFLISGFVIYYSVRNKPLVSAREYFSRRTLRIYPILLLSFAFSRYLCGRSGNLVANLAMLQDFKFAKPGVWFDVYGGNSALWSLSYEWWFYCLFFLLFRFVDSTKQQVIVTSLAVSAGLVFSLVPNEPCLFLIYFPIWWAGVELSKCYSAKIRPTLVNQKHSVIALASGFAYFGCWSLLDAKRHIGLSLGLHPVLEARHFLAALVILLGACLLSASGRKRFFAVLRPLALVAPISYAMYVFHIPLVIQAHYLDGILGQAAVLAYAAILLLAAFLAEIPFQKLINMLAQPLLRQEGPNVPASEVSVRP